MGGGGGKGGGFIKEGKFWSICRWWGRIHLSHVAKNPHPGGKILTDRQKIYFTYFSSLIQPTCKAMFHGKTLSLIFKNE